MSLGGEENFLASNEWLRSFCSRHQIKHANLHGESDEVDQNVCIVWRQTILPSIIKGYHPSDIFNCNETSVFFHAVNNKSFILLGEAPKGVKALKERVSILLTCSAKGKRLPPLIIQKSAKPWSFPKDTTDLLRHIHYKQKKKAWMTCEIFTEYLNALNNKMVHQGRHILLLMDNCSGHPNITLSNVKIQFLPKGMTSELQPLDRGIIALLKKFYQKEMMSDVNEVLNMPIMFQKCVVLFIYFQEVVAFLLEYKAVEILTGIISQSKAPRMTVRYLN